MTHKELPVIFMLFFLALAGFQCNSNPNGTPRLSSRQLNSAAYDRFFHQFERFEVNRFGDQALRRGGAIYFTRRSPQGVKYTGAKPAAGAYMAVDGHPEMALAIYYDADLNNAPPPMQLQLLARRDLEEGGFVGELADPIILCDMNDAQSEAVLKGGIPESLIDTMVQTALASGWRPTFEETNQFGMFIHVDAQTHFSPRR